MKFKQGLMGAISLALLLLAGSVGFAQDTADSEFARKAADAGTAEVEMGQLAQKQSSSGTVQQFAKRMVADHTKAGDELEQIASKDGITLPPHVDINDQAPYNHLSKISGAEFDSEYAYDMVADHEKAVAMFQKEATDGKNPDLKSFASKTLPTLRQHLKMAREMEKSVSPNESSKNN